MTFLDTNVLVYAVDQKDPSKQAKARDIIVDAIGGHSFVVSAQVLNEFSNIALLKLKMSVPELWKQLPDPQEGSQLMPAVVNSECSAHLFPEQSGKFRLRQ